MKNSRLLLALLVLIILGIGFYFTKVTDNIGWYNSGEFVAAAITMDVPHAPGYPLLTRLANLSLALPFEVGPAMKMNLLSAIIGLLAILLNLVFLYLAGLRILPALVASILLLASKTYFDQAILIEVYCLEVLLVISGLMVGIFIARDSNSRVTAFFAGLVGTIGVGHRPTFVLYAVALYFFINVRKEPLKKLSLAWFAIGMILGFLPSLDLYFRLQSGARLLLDPMIGQGIWGFLQVYTGTVYGGGLFSLGFNEVLQRFFYFFKFIFDDVGFFVLPLAFVALFRQREDSPVLKALVFIGMINLLFVLNYNAFEAHSMLLPCIFSLCALAGYSLNRIKAPGARTLVCVLVAVSALLIAYPKQNSLDSESVDFCRRFFQKITPGTMAVMSNDVEFRPYYYLRLTENFRKDVAVQLLDDIGLKELRGLASIIEKRDVAGTFVYPHDAIEKLVASFSLVAEGYGFNIVSPQTPALDFARFAAKDKISLGDSSILLPESQSYKLSAGGSLDYAYAFSGQVEDFKQLQVITFITDSENRKIWRNGLLTGHDSHMPAKFVAANLLSEQQKIEVALKRSLVVPYDLEPGNYQLHIIFRKSAANPANHNELKIESLNLFNREGFLEVFKLNYGQSNRILFDRPTFAAIETSPAFTCPLQVQ